LKVDDFLGDLGVPFLPLVAAGTAQAVADIEVREEFLTANGSEAISQSSRC
jgi:hypothetical protein